MREGLAGDGAAPPGRAIRIAAQQHLEAFYASLGFRTVGAPFDEDGIPHVEMLREAALRGTACRDDWPDFPPAFYPVAIVAILLTGIAKGGFGAGAGGIAVPLMSVFIAPPEAAGIMLPILCAMDLFGVHAYRGRWSREHLRAMLPGAIAGIAIGAFAFGTLPVNGIRLLLGIISVVFALNQGFALTERLAARLERSRDKPGRSPARSGARCRDSPARSPTPAARRSPSTCCRSGSTSRCWSAPPSCSSSSSTT